MSEQTDQTTSEGVKAQAPRPARVTRPKNPKRVEQGKKLAQRNKEMKIQLEKMQQVVPEDSWSSASASACAGALPPPTWVWVLVGSIGVAAVYFYSKSACASACPLDPVCEGEEKPPPPPPAEKARPTAHESVEPELFME